MERDRAKADDIEFVLQNTSTGEEKPALKRPNYHSYFNTLSPDGRFLVTLGSRDKTMRVSDLDSSREVVAFDSGVKPNSLSSNPVKFSPDGKRVAIGSLDGTIRLWNLPEAKKNEK